MQLKVGLILVLLLASSGSAFVGSKIHHGFNPSSLFIVNKESFLSRTSARGNEINWMDRVVPFDAENDKEDTIRRVGDIVEYNIGISGVSFQTGPLSAKMYKAIMSRQDEELMSEEMVNAYKVYAMDFTAKEATRTALKQNGFDIQIQNEDVGIWAKVDTIQLLDGFDEPVGPSYNSLTHAVDFWTPGQAFHFVARGVSAKLTDIALQEVLDALDPDGSLRNTAEASGIKIPTEDLQSLTDLSYEVKRRCDDAPRGAVTPENVFKGDHSRGYSAVSRSDLLVANTNSDGSENQSTLMHVMNSLVSHGCLIVDLSDKGTNFDLPLIMAKMWETSENFFTTLDAHPEREALLPKMTSIPATPYAKMGFVNFLDGMKFMETRVDRATGDVMPTQLSMMVGEVGMNSLRDAFHTITSVGKDVVRIATAASSLENFGFIEAEQDPSSIRYLSRPGDECLAENPRVPEIQASMCAKLMVDELLDDGTIFQGSGHDGSVSMSPLRLCLYSNIKEDTPTEVFGAHTDSSFVTIVPVAAVSGLEVYDEDAQQWYRPELRARCIWEADSKSDGKDGQAFFETIPQGDGGIQIPWHARYAVVMPGEFLQVVTRNEVAASVHRVVASAPTRVSAPVLVRGRPGMTMNVQRYLGRINDKLLEQVDGWNMLQIHDALQPKRH